MWNLRRLVAATAVVVGFVSQGKGEDSPVRISSGEIRNDGWLTHTVQSPYQKGQTKIHVLLPKEVDDARTYPVLYLLPVEPLDQTRWGDAMTEAVRADLANKHNVICVYATFSHLPWYADHPSDPHLRQETYFLKVVVPFVEKEYPAIPKREGRFLAGFSKSGWGAWSLLLRHPDLFEKAAAWDAPLMEAAPKKYGMGPIFGSDENFQKYQITQLVEQRAKELEDRPRLVLTGYDGSFRRQHQQMHALLEKLGVPHIYRDGPQRRHHWESGWLGEAVELMHANEE